MQKQNCVLYSRLSVYLWLPWPPDPQRAGWKRQHGTARQPEVQWEQPADGAELAAGQYGLFRGVHLQQWRRQPEYQNHRCGHNSDHLWWSWMALISLKRCFLKARQAPAILTISKERFIYQYLDTLRFLHFRLDLVGECRFHIYIEGEDDAILHSRIVVENQRWRWKHP